MQWKWQGPSSRTRTDLMDHSHAVPVPGKADSAQLAAIKSVKIQARLERYNLSCNLTTQVVEILYRWPVPFPAFLPSPFRWPVSFPAFPFPASDNGLSPYLFLPQTMACPLT